MKTSKEFPKMNRISFEDLWFSIVELLERRSTCLRRKVGAVLVKDNIVLAMAWNGSPSGMPHCEETGCIRKEQNIESGTRLEFCRALHAEQNLLLHCCKKQVSIENSVLYVSVTPCVSCMKMLIEGKISKIVYKEMYNDQLALSMVKGTGIRLVKYKSEKSLE